MTKILFDLPDNQEYKRKGKLIISNQGEIYTTSFNIWSHGFKGKKHSIESKLKIKASLINTFNKKRGDENHVQNII